MEKFKLGNATSGGRQWSTLQANPVLESQLSIHKHPHTNNIKDLRPQYQIVSGHHFTLGQNIWNANVAGDLWQLGEDDPLPIIFALTPIAYFSWSIEYCSGLAIITDILSSSSHDVRAD